MERKKSCCSSTAFHHLAAVMNKRSEEVKVRGSLLDEVAECHVRHGGGFPPRALTAKTTAKQYVDREILFNFVQDHGEVCGKGVPDGWVPSRIIRGERMKVRALLLETKAMQKRNAKAAKNRPGKQKRKAVR